MNKNPVKRGLPPSSTRPIVKSELDPALFVKARQDLPVGTSPDEIDAYALRLEQFRKLLRLAAHFSVNVLVGETGRPGGLADFVRLTALQDRPKHTSDDVFGAEQMRDAADIRRASEKTS
jgi:hypothetical protein